MQATFSTDVRASIDLARALTIPEEKALRDRASLITPQHTIRGMFMRSTLECLRRIKGQAAVDAALDESKLPERDWPAMRKVPLADFNTLRTVVAHALVPELGSVEAAVARIAGASVEIFFDSVAGRTMMFLAGRDPHRLLSAAPNGYVLAVDDGAVRTYEKLDEERGVFRFAGDRLGPCHQAGVFTTAIGMVCGVKIDIDVEQKSLLDFTFRMSW